jgi:hypothetical protein
MTDADLLSAFDRGVLPEPFGHREHVRAGFALLARERDLAAAAVAFRRVVRAVGGAKYHETITWAYLAMIGERMAGHDYPSSLDFVEAHPDLLDFRDGALARHSDVAELLASPHARTSFVLPRRS